MTIRRCAVRLADSAFFEMRSLAPHRCRCLGAAIGGVALCGACNSIESTPAPPVNSCAASPCSAYVQAGAQPKCVLGACLVTAPAAGLVVLVDIPAASAFAPGGTFAAPFEQLLQAQPE